MKKLLILGLLSGFFWADQVEENIIKAFEGEKMPVKKIIAIETLNSGLSIALVEEENGMQMPVFITSDGKNIIGIGDPLIMGDHNFQEKLRLMYKTAMHHNQKSTDVKILKSVPEDAWIHLNGQGKSGSIYMVVDANCSFCKQEIAKLEETMKNYKDVSLLFVGLLNENSLHKATKVYKLIKNTKSQQQIMAIIHQSFDKNFKADKNVDNSFAQKNSKAIISAGVRGVPYIITD
ncbi:thioredoxin domain-containing protein [Helicobacter mustelae]|uniref:Disulfide isomerase DsbG N-terminal domain-containing protein n=1 Tax=Helicobacter mustelae (strain ATCC 43772 / CCUG 25715 / CIP 103759 / LMG 18044 / NCTC 12198 / R85-136P) TaxID=679897 RepID=D3UJ26_HELM1|nr:hypothetical protein [Helicobacter mustelae]CBG40501.1 Putative hypothetical protein [Helicobacter mustelae 12198]SQH72000.1 putative disulfide isomerase [Helicobacter mustelae]STP13143.1 putative disulfide isomerase [Helicobacter mustelae]